MPSDLHHCCKQLKGSCELVPEEGMCLDLADDILKPVADMLMHIVEDALRARKCWTRPAPYTPLPALELYKQTESTYVAKVSQPTLTWPKGVLSPSALPYCDISASHPKCNPVHSTMLPKKLQPIWTLYM